ncbi:hypothetical protein [Silvimonas iriomotensis]|uniref:Uncharacterized protein n=1 Tax=Silvimonas iriomotensis TaxID=449662 RepID=A0ABQ2PEW1_9NEIS|nr:hypothetical protein [Silvimonas iriomotensis]GGP23729.1 hypothetical protein GCM10010970_37290 [Silvimonas iriomotensis]
MTIEQTVNLSKASPSTRPKLLTEWKQALDGLVHQNPAIVFFLLASVWMLCHPWFGFWHDGMLYLGQTLHRISPEHYPGDPFFMFGSQDDYTLFTRIYALVIKGIGIANAGLLLTFIALFSWFCAFYLCCRAVFKSSYAPVVATIAIVLLPPNYGGFAIFRFAENFLTARSAAEPAVLFALFFMLRQRHIASLLVFAVACLMHPLVGFSGLTVWLVYVFMYPPAAWTRKALIATCIAGSVVVGILALKHDGPFGQLFQVYTGSWLNLILAFNLHVFISSWPLNDLYLISGSMVLSLVYIRHGNNPRLKQLVCAITVATLVSLAISLIFADWLRVILITSMQIWRILWICQALIPCLVVTDMLLDRKNLSLPALWAMALATAGLIMRGNDASLILALLGLALAYVQVVSVRESVQKLVSVALVLVVALAIIGDNLSQSIFIGVQFFTTNYPFLYPHLVPVICGSAIVLAILILRSKPVAVLLTVLFFTFSTVVWDRRPGPEIFFENAAQNNPFEKYIGVDETVYWNSFRPLPWMIFNRASYSNGMTAAPILFNYDYGMEFIYRFHHMQSLYVKKDECTPFRFQEGNCGDRPDTINPTLCERDDRINWIVSYYKSGLPAVAHWKFVLPGLPDGLYLYSCKQWLSLPKDLVKRTVAAEVDAAEKAGTYKVTDTAARLSGAFK